MLTSTPAMRVFVALQPVDLRKSFSGLSGLVQEVLRQDLLSGCLFVFTNRQRTRMANRRGPPAFARVILGLGRMG